MAKYFYKGSVKVFKNKDVTIYVEWSPINRCYRLYDPKYPGWTIAYVDEVPTFEELCERYGD